MRDFTTVNRRAQTKPSLQLSILASDASSTYIYNDIDILDVPNIRYRGPFGGGMAQPVAYNISLGFKTIGEVKDVKDKLLQGTSTLQVTVNSDQFTPHIGRVKTTKRPGTDPLRLELGIVDKFFDDDPTIPKTLLSDSFDNVHPADINGGYPLYYGNQSKRPFYMSLVDCLGIQYLGPRNVSSAFHTSSVYYHSQQANVETDPNFIVNEPIKYIWGQQSGSNNFCLDVTSTWKFESAVKFAENSGNRIHNFIAGNGVWLADVSCDGGSSTRAATIYRTGNLIDWEEVYKITNVISQTLVTDSKLLNFANNNFYLPYKSGGFAVSSDNGQNWATLFDSDLTETSWGHNLLWTGSGYFTITKQSQSGRRLFSADGTNWSRVGCADNIADMINGGTVFAPGRLMILQGVNSDGNPRYFHSSDHTITTGWVETAPIDINQTFSDITYAESPGYFVSIGFVTSDGTRHLRIEASSDGENWINVFCNAGIGAIPNAVGYNDGLVHVVGTNGLYFVSSSVIDSSGWANFSGGITSHGIIDYIEFDNKGRYVANTTILAADSGQLYGYWVNGTYPFGGNDNYYRYAVYADTNSANTAIAISENPIAILDHVSSLETLTPYLQSVSSASQAILSNSGYKFHCFFAEPRASQEVVNEFGQLAATNFWMADSGMLHSSVYVESASATIDETVTPDDMISWEIEENSPQEHRAAQAANYTLQWAYNFQTEKYNNITVKNPSNNSFCESMSALGVNKFFKLDTKYITDSATANFAINNFIRLMGQGSEVYRFKLGPWAMALELNDTLKVQNPMIVGSEALAQITGIDYNLNTGAVSVVAEKLLEGP